MLLPLTIVLSAITYDAYASEMMAMAIHFLLSSKAKTLSLKAIYSAGEDTNYETRDRRRGRLPALRLPGVVQDHDAPSLQVLGLLAPVQRHQRNHLRFAQDVLH
jgi:hypothetical protein